MNFADLKIILGLGKTGLSCVRYLAKKGLNIAVCDSRENPPYLTELKEEFPNIPVFLGKFDEALLNKASELIISPGLSLKNPEIALQIKRGIPVIGDIELFAREINLSPQPSPQPLSHGKWERGVPKIIAITGSNGKSTVTTLVGEMAKDAGVNVEVGGNLGTPVLDLLQDKKPEFFVLELSSFQLETTFSLHPEAAVVLNVTPDHMDRYKDFNEYLKAKQLIYRNAKFSIVNRDDPMSFANLSLSNVVSFGLDTPKENNFGYSDGFLLYGSEKLIKSSELKIKGRHQIANALAALALGKAVGLSFDSMLNTLQNFTGLKHRCQFVRTLHGLDFYNDSKGTNIGATDAAISGIGSEINGKIILIAGGLGKDADFRDLRSSVKKYVRSVILIGEDALKIEAALQGITDIKHAKSMHEAVEIAVQTGLKPVSTNNHDVVLLSPACASFDMFKNFEHRGDVFIEEVNNLEK